MIGSAKPESNVIMSGQTTNIPSIQTAEELALFARDGRLAEHRHPNIELKSSWDKRVFSKASG